MGTEEVTEERPTSSRARRRRGPVWAVPGGMVVAALLVGACGPGATPSTNQGTQNATIVARADSFIRELGGAQFARLSRAQRWRAVASLGTGLPPAGFSATDLPEPHSTGAGLLQAYCTQCHELPTPQMHSAIEWPILLKRMVLRMSLLEKRVEGPFLQRVGGEELRSAVTFRSVPTADQLDSLRAYLTRNALPAAKPGEVPPGPQATVFENRCSVCHQLPSPKAHTASEWVQVVPRMQKNMELMQVDTLPTDQVNAVESFLKAHAARGGSRH